MPVQRTDVVTVFLTRGDAVLLLRRSDAVGTYRGFWAGVSGHLETADAAAQARVEIEEELGLGPDQAALQVAGEPLEVPDPAAGRVWLVHPFRFALQGDAEPRLDWEHVEMCWCRPEEIHRRQTVPGLWEAWVRVAPRV